MLLGPHGSRIDVHVRVYFDGGDLEAGGLEEQARGGGYKGRLNACSMGGREGESSCAPMTPFPMPLTTPPETRMYLVIAGGRESRSRVPRNPSNFPLRFSASSAQTCQNNATRDARQPAQACTRLFLTPCPRPHVHMTSSSFRECHCARVLVEISATSFVRTLVHEAP